MVTPGSQDSNRKFQVKRRHFLASAAIMLSGCKNLIHRSQSPDDVAQLASSAGGAKYIDEVTGLWGLNRAKVEGIALVTQLDGTGSDPPRSGRRTHLISEMNSHRADDVDEILADKNTSLALIRGFLPPGVKAGERFDLYVATEPKSTTTSLRNGFVMQTRMRPMVQLEARVREGHVSANGKGRILVDSLFETNGDKTAETRGHILGGGVALKDRPYGLAIRDEARSLRTATGIARAINERFSVASDDGKVGVADPKNDRVIHLATPSEYKHNIGRFIQVVRNTAFGETDASKIGRMELLERELNDPNLCRRAALRLEAIGSESVAILKRAMRHDDDEVRFHAAEALAYLAVADAAEELENAARDEPAFRWHALTALASMDDLSAGVSLTNLMQVESAETRYGAFRAMRARSPHDPVVKGQLINGEFYLHVVPSTGSPMIHFSRYKRPEIVIFDGTQTVADNFLFVESGLTVKATQDGKVEMIVYLPGKGERRELVSNRISDIVFSLAALGCDYSTFLSIFKDAQKTNSLNSRLVIDAVPKPERLYTNARLENGISRETSQRYVSGPLPELFNGGSEIDSATGMQPRRSPDSESGEKPTKSKKGIFGKMRKG